MPHDDKTQPGGGFQAPGGAGPALPNTAEELLKERELGIPYIEGGFVKPADIERQNVISMVVGWIQDKMSGAKDPAQIAAEVEASGVEQDHPGLLSELLGGRLGAAPSITSSLGLTGGLSKEDLVRMYDLAVSLGIAEMMPSNLERPPSSEAQALISVTGELPQEEDLKAAIVVDWLDEDPSGAAGQLTRLVVQTYAESTGRWYTDMRTASGVKLTDIATLMSQYGLDFKAAQLLAETAQTQKADVLKFADAYVNASKEGKVTSVEEFTKPFEKTVRGASGAIRTEEGGFAFDTAEAKVSVYGYATDYAQGLALYNQDHFMAQVYASDPELAAKLRANPYELTFEELRAVDQAVGGVANKTEFTNGLYDNTKLDWLASRLQGAQPRVEVDSRAIFESAKNLAEAWNLPVDDAVLNGIVSGFGGAVQRAAQQALGNPFAAPELSSGVNLIDSPQSATAFAAQRLRGTPEYRYAFAQKPLGETEEAFAARFRSEVTSLLGPGHSDPELARLGMHLNDPNAIARAALGQQLETTEADPAAASSDFLERLYRMGNIFGRLGGA